MKKWLAGWLLALAVTCVLTTPMRAQNTSTSGTITAGGSACGAANCVYYQLPLSTDAVPKETPWVVVTVSGTWAGTLEIATVSAPNANYSNLNSVPWFGMASEYGNGSWAVSTNGARYLLVVMTNWSSGTAQVTMTASQVGAPLINPVLAGTATAKAVITNSVALPTGGSPANCFATDGSILAGCGGSLPSGTIGQMPSYTTTGSTVQAVNVSRIPVEFAGATPYTSEAAAEAGPDDTAHFQTAVTDAVNGVATCQAAMWYHVDGPVNFSSSEGLVGTANQTYGGLCNLVSNSATTNILSAVGTSSAYLTGIRWANLSIHRSVVPAGTASGIYSSFNGGTIVQNILSYDSIYDFYRHASPGYGIGYWTHNQAGWLLSESSGTYYGFYDDSADGNGEDSIILTHSAVDCVGLTGSAVGYGQILTGSAISDNNTFDFNTAGCSYGQVANYTGGGGVSSASDIHWYASTHDEFKDSAFEASGLPTASTGSLEISGGWADSSSTSGGNGVIYLLNSAGVSVNHVSIGTLHGSSGEIYGITDAGGTGNIFVGNTFHDQPYAINETNNTTGDVAANNRINNSGTGALNIAMQANNGANNNIFTGNNVSGLWNIGLRLDASYITDLPNAFGSGVTQPIYDGGTGNGLSAPVKLTTAGTTVNGFQATGANNFTGWNNATPSSAYTLGFTLPAGTAGTNFIIGCYGGAAWQSCLTFNTSTLAAAFGGAVTAPSFTDSGLGVSLPVCTNGSSTLTTTSCNIATLGGTQTFSAPITFTGGVNFTAGSIGINAVGFYINGTTLVAISGGASLQMAPVNTATSSNNYAGTITDNQAAYWSGTIADRGGFTDLATPATGNNPLITLTHSFNANDCLGCSGGTATGQETWNYPVTFASTLTATTSVTTPTLTATTSVTTPNVNGVLNAASCGYASPPSWCAGSDIGAWVNAAILSQEVSGFPEGTVFIPTGNYTQTTTITIPAATATEQATFKLKFDRGAVLNYTGTGVSIVGTGTVYEGSHVIIDSPHIVGTVSGSAGIEITGYGYILDNPVINGFDAASGTLTGAGGANIWFSGGGADIRNIGLASSQNCILLTSTASQQPNAIHVFGGEMDSCVYGWSHNAALDLLHSGENNILEGVVFEADTTSILDTNSRNFVIEGNYIEASANTAITLGSASGFLSFGATVSSNYISGTNSAVPSIAIYNSDSMVVLGNKEYGSSSQLLYTSGTISNSIINDGSYFTFGPVTSLSASTLTATTSVTTPQLLGTVDTLSGATPAINAAHRDFTITLSANATATVTGLAAGEDINAQVCQPATGGPYTWTWPTAFHGGVTIGTTASTCSMQTFHSFNGTTLVAMGTGVINVAP